LGLNHCPKRVDVPEVDDVEAKELPDDAPPLVAVGPLAPCRKPGCFITGQLTGGEFLGYLAWGWSSSEGPLLGLLTEIAPETGVALSEVVPSRP